MVRVSHVPSVAERSPPRFQSLHSQNVHNVPYDLPEHFDPQLHIVLIKPTDYCISSETRHTLYEGAFVCPSEIRLHQETEMSPLMDYILVPMCLVWKKKKKEKARSRIVVAPLLQRFLTARGIVGGSVGQCIQVSTC